MSWETRRRVRPLSGHKATGPVIGIHWWFIGSWPRSQVFSWFYRMLSLWCNNLWHLSRWPLIPRRKLDQLKADTGCGVSQSPGSRPWQSWLGAHVLSPCSSNLDIYPNGETWHEVEQPDRVMQWQSREMMRTQNHDESGRENKNIKPWTQLSTWISSTSQ